MKLTVLFAALVAALATFSAAPVVMANDVSDVVRARANARAGGSTSGHDAYILKKHGGALSGTKSYKSKSYKAKKKAAAKRRAKQAARKKAAAKRRAAIAAKKKKEAQRRAALAAKRKKAQEADEASEKTEDQASKSDQSDGTSTSTPSTAAILTKQDSAGDGEKAKSESDTTAVAKAGDAAKTAGDNNAAEETTTQNKDSAEDTEDNCKRFIPEVGKTVTVDC